MVYNMSVIIFIFLVYFNLYYDVLRLQKYSFSFSVHFEYVRNPYKLYFL